MRMRILLSTGLVLLALAAVAGAKECRYSAPRNMDLDGSALKSLSLNLRATDAHVIGVAGLSKVEVRGIACASDPQWLQDIQIDASRHGDEATLTVRTGQHGGGFSLFGFSHYAYLKLSVRVPQQLAIAIDSGSGDVVAEALAALDFHSGSGDLRAHEIADALVLQVGSGNVDAQQVGSVYLHGTGSGDVTVSEVRGDAQADYSGSGDLHFSNVGGGVRVGSIGSGDVHLEHIGRNVRVGTIGSGDVTADDVGGDMEVGAAGSGDVRYHGVKGTVRVPKGG